MITVLISDNDDKVRELLKQAISKEDIAKIIRSDNIDGIASLKDAVTAVEKPLIEHTLRQTEGNQLKAARILGINRNTIRSKIKKLGIDANKWKIYR